MHFKNDASGNYPGREKGGARPALRTRGLDSGDSCTSEPSNTRTSRTGIQLALATIAGGPCSRLTQAEVLSLPVWRTVRLLMEESSISARMACRSSEAEITGNSRTSTHAKASKNCSAVTRRSRRAAAPRRHSQYPGNPNNTHARLSNSSIADSYKRPNIRMNDRIPNLVFQMPELEVNVTTVPPTKRPARRTRTPSAGSPH